MKNEILIINMKQMSKWKVTSDNVKFYDNIMKTKGRVVSLDFRPYMEFLNEFAIFYTK